MFEEKSEATRKKSYPRIVKIHCCYRFDERLSLRKGRFNRCEEI